MKKIALSLAAIALIATAVQADIKSKSFGGSASLFYGTNDANNGDLFNKGTSYGDAAMELHGAAAVGGCDTCVTLNYGVTGVSTLGLENTLVADTWIGDDVTLVTPPNAFGPRLRDAVWIDTLNLAFQPLDGISNTTMVIGRQALDTPMVFTEKWNIAKNTYDAAVAVNNDIEETTLVGAWVGRSNVAGGRTVNARNIGNGFSKFLTDEGAYAFGAVTKLIPAVTAQAWYYVAPSVANVAWVQADTDIAGFALGGQFVYTDPNGGDTGNGFAVKIGYNYEGLGLSAAYSSMNDKLMTAANLGGSQSKLYTEAWWGYGEVGQTDTDSYNVTATYSIEGIADLGVYYTNVDHKVINSNDYQEVAVTAGKDFGNLNLTLAYITSDYDGDTDTNGNEIDAKNDIQVYATYTF